MAGRQFDPYATDAPDEGLAAPAPARLDEPLMPDAEPEAGAPAEDGGETPFVSEPRNVQETGLGLSFLVDLLSKAIYYGADPTPLSLSEQLRLPLRVVDEVLQIMRQQTLVEVQGQAGMGERQYIFALSDKGQRRAAESIERNQYIGPAPVPFERYLEVQARQNIGQMSVSREDVQQALTSLVLPDSVIDSIGAALTSTRSMLIYGESGNGKSSITTAMRSMLPGEVLVPYALDVGGQIVRLLDPRVHEQVEVETPADRRNGSGSNPIAIGSERRGDKRFAVCRRPVVTVGGELTLEDLELRYSQSGKFYVAPPQVKANGGILVVEDFGRQIVQPRELLNRWIMPMEAGVDQLTFQSGESIQVPFNLMVVFSTNLAPGDLGDEAFLRRIRHKVLVPNPQREHYLQILRTVCETAGVPFQEAGADYLLEEFYLRSKREFRGCHPGDIVQTLVDIAGFRDVEPRLDGEQLRAACASYFVDQEASAA
jgi:hypothetical protein